MTFVDVFLALAKLTFPGYMYSFSEWPMKMRSFRTGKNFAIYGRSCLFFTFPFSPVSRWITDVYMLLIKDLTRNWWLENHMHREGSAEWQMIALYAIHSSVVGPPKSNRNFSISNTKICPKRRNRKFVFQKWNQNVLSAYNTRTFLTTRRVVFWK